MPDTAGHRLFFGRLGFTGAGYSLFFSLYLSRLMVWIGLLLPAGFLFITPANAGQVTSNGTGGGNWSQDGTWSGGALPASNDTVFIAAGDLVTLDQNATIKRLVFSAGTSANVLTHSSVETLTVTGQVVLEGPTANNQDQQWNINAGTALVSGNLILNRDTSSGVNSRTATVTITTGSLSADSLVFNNTDSFDERTQVRITGTGTISASGATVFNTNGRLDCGSAGTFTFTGSGNRTLVQSGPPEVLFHDVDINLASTADTVFLGANIDQTYDLVNGSLAVQGGVFDASNGGNNTFTISLVNGESFSVADGAVFITAGGGTNAFPKASSGSITVTLDSTSTVVYSRSGAQTVAAQTYGHLTLTSSGTKTIGGDMTVKGNLTGGGTVTIDLGTQTITANASDTLALGSGVTMLVSGANNFPSGFGTFSLNAASTVKYDAGDRNQTVAAVSYGNLDLDNGKGGGFSKNLAGAVAINGDLNIRGDASVNAGAFSHTAAGDWTVSSGGTFTSTGTVTFNGTTQSITRGTFNKVVFAGSGTKTVGSITGTDLDIDGNLTINSGVTLSAAGTRSITVGGDWTNNGTFSVPGTVTFDGTDQSISTSDFDNITLAGSGTKTLTGAVDVGGNFTINGPTVSGGSSHHKIAGNLSTDDTNGGTFTSTDSVTFDGTTQTIDGDGTTFGHVVFAGSGTKTVADNGLDVDSSLTINSGVTLNGSSYSHTVAGDWTNNGTFSSSGTVTFDGAKQSISASTFDDVVFAGSDTATATGAFDLSGNLTINSGATFNAGSFNHTLEGDWTDNGTFVASTSTITFDGGADRDITTTETFYNLTLNKTSGANALANNVDASPVQITVQNDLTITDGEFRLFDLSGTELTVQGNLTIANNAATALDARDTGADGVTIEIGGNLINNNTTAGTNNNRGFDFESSTTVVLNGSGSKRVKSPAEAFESLTLSKTGSGSVTADGNLTVNGTLTLSGGNINSADDSLLTLGSSVTIVGGSASSFVNGPLAHTWSGTTVETKTFPIGKGSVYRPLEINLSSLSGGPIIKAEVFNEDAGGTAGSGLQSISSVRYYQISVTNSGGGATADSAKAKITFGSDDGVSSLGTTMVARSTTRTGTYNSLGQSATSGTPSSGTVTSNTFDPTEAGDFLLLGFQSSTPSQLAITTVSPNPPVVDESFSITIESQNDAGSTAGVSQNTAIALTLVAGSGTLSGTTTGTIDSGQSSVTISGIKYDTAESGVKIRAAVTSGDTLSPDTTDALTFVTAFYSNVNTTGRPEDLSNWNSERNGSGSAPGSFSGVFVIQNTDTMTTQSNWSASSVDLRVENGGMLTTDNTTNLRSLLIENGGRVRANARIDITSGQAFEIQNGGTYVHNNTIRYDTSILQGNETFADSSNFEVIESGTGGLSAFSGVSFGNLTWNDNTGTQTVNLAGNLTDIDGNFSVQSTGSGGGALQLSSSSGQTFTLTIDGNFSVSGGSLTLTNGAAVPTISVGGNLEVSGGTLLMTNGTGDPQVTVSGSVTVSGGTLNMSNNNGGQATLKVGDTLSHTAGTITETAGGSGTIEFNGSSAQAWTPGGTLSNTINFTINNSNGVTLVDNVTINGTLTLSDGTLTTTSSKLLTLGTSAGVSGGNASSFVNGPLAHTWGTSTQAKTFAIGDSAYRPLVITLTGPTSPVMIAQVFSDSSTGGSLESPLIAISTSRFYKTQITSGSADSATVKITFGSDDGVNNLSSLVVARSTTLSGAYRSLGQSASSGSPSNGTVTSKNYDPTEGTDFLLLGTTANDNPLPVVLDESSVSLSSTAEGIVLRWVTRSEIQNAKWFVERQAEGEESWLRIAELRGQGSTTQQTGYSVVDTSVEVNTTYAYRLVEVSFSGVITMHGPYLVTHLVQALPKGFALYQNFPNPFNPTTTIKFDIPQTSRTSLVIYNTLGQEVRRLVNNQVLEPHHYTLVWDGTDKQGRAAGNGVYFYRLSTDQFTYSKKMLLLR